jgi:hypothetical protein
MDKNAFNVYGLLLCTLRNLGSATGCYNFPKKRSELQGDQMSLGKNRSKCSQNYFLPKLIHTQLLLLKKEDPK